MNYKNQALNGFKDYKIIKRFKSRKNDVYLIHMQNNNKIINAIYKKFNSFTSKDKELILLKGLKHKGLKVPDVFYESEDYIVKEYIEGQTLLDSIIAIESNQSKEINQAMDLLIKVFDWMDKFYIYSKEIVGKDIILEDINFRNFLIKKNDVYGIDFEDSHEGHRERDGGRFCAFMLNYEPTHTKWKIDITKLLFQIMINKFKYQKEELICEFNEEIIEIEKRRGAKTPKNIVKEILNNI